MKDRLVRLLRWSERYTKTDMRYLAKGGFWVTANYVLQVALGLITTIALANLLPKEALGTYQFILSVAAILSVLTLSGLGVAITRAVAQGHEGVLRTGIRTKLLWSIGIVLGSGATALYYYLQDNPTLALAFLIVGAFAPFIESCKLYENYLNGKEAFRDMLLLGFWRKPLPVIALVTTVFFTDSVLTLIFVYFATNALSLALVLWLVLRKYQPPSETDSETLTLSKHLSFLKLFGAVGSHADKVLIWHFLGAAPVAAYTIAQLSTKYSGSLLTTVTKLVLPRVAKRDLPTLQKTLPRKVRLFILLMALGAATYIIIAPFVFPILFPEYPESIPYTQLLALTLLFIPNRIYSQTLVAHNQMKSYYTLTTVTTFLKLGLLYVLLPRFEVWGAIYAILITGIIGSILIRYFFFTAKATGLTTPK